MASRTDKKWTKDEIQAQLQADTQWLYHGIVAIYKMQTDDEKSSGDTRNHNGVGFGKFDAEFLSRMARKLKAERRLDQREISGARKCMKKYAGQLARIANNEI